MNKVKKFTLLLLILTCPNLWAMKKEEYLILMAKVSSNDVSDKEIIMFATCTYNRFKDAEKRKKELSETTQRGIDALIQNGRYAQVMDDDIKAAAAKFENGRMIQKASAIDWEYDFGALSVIKTPESVHLCGKYLKELTEPPPMPKQPQVTGECWTPNNEGGNSYYAAKALQNMGIKNGPVVDDLGDPVIALWQEWFEEVKSGARAFSFEGQEVAYRFKPDGSYESLDAKAAESHNQRIRPRPTVSSAAGETTDKETKSDRNWVVFGALFVVLCFTYWFKFRRAGAKG